MATATIPTLTLNNGVAMPALGLGVFQNPPEETTAAVEAAIAYGYPLVDTAAAYGNEREVGRAIRRSGIDRSAIFIVTKLWISDYGHDEALVGFDGSLRRLGVDHVDLFLLHQPLPSEFDRTIGAYKAIEEMLAAGRTRALGVSNFMPDHLESLLGQVDVDLAERHRKTPAQVVLRWHVEHGFCAIPKSVKPHRIAENIDVFDFRLSS